VTCNLISVHHDHPNTHSVNMTSGSQRDTLFPATSIGRSQGARLTRTPSHESLTAHPLLSPLTSEPNASGNSQGSTTPASVHPPGPKYVPYTPRQRPATVAATVTMSSSSPTATAAAPPSSTPQPDATSKLQAMNMKAEAQTIGLDTGSIGWAMLEKLTSETENWADWAELWSALTSSKVCHCISVHITVLTILTNRPQFYYPSKPHLLH
jgi:hypothetical protein